VNDKGLWEVGFSARKDGAITADRCPRRDDFAGNPDRYLVINNGVEAACWPRYWRAPEVFPTLTKQCPRSSDVTDGQTLWPDQRRVVYTGLTLESHGRGWDKPFHPTQTGRAGCLGRDQTGKC
jgi:hypothetical protein